MRKFYLDELAKDMRDLYMSLNEQGFGHESALTLAVAFFEGGYKK